MKKSVLLLCLFAAACGRSGNEGFFVIEGRVKSLKDSTVITLYEQKKNFWVTKDTDTVINGKFAFRVPIKENTMFSVNAPFDDPGFSAMGRDIYGSPGEKAVIKGGNNLIYTWTVKSKVPEQTISDRYMLASKKEYDKLQLLLMEEKKTILGDPDGNAGKTIDSLKRLREDVRVIILRNDIAIMDETPVSKPWIEKLLSLSIAARQYDQQQWIRDEAIRLYGKLSEDEKNGPQGKRIHMALFVPPDNIPASEIGGV